MRFVLPVVLAILTTPGFAGPGERDRHEFSQRLRSIRIGMSEVGAREILGEPDDIRTHEDPNVVIGNFDIREIWCYGTAGHLAFPTLGQVGIGEDGTVHFVCGDRPPPPPGPIEEPELRRILTNIDRIPAIEFGFARHYNPLDMIRVVNALQPLGRETAFVVLDEYMRLTGASQPPENLVLVCLALFAPDPKAPPPSLYLPWENHRVALPHYPIVIREDVPLFVFPLGGYFRTGPAMPTAPTIEHFRKNGRIRAVPLTPPVDPLQVLARFEASPAWPFVERATGWRSEADTARTLIMNQLLWLLDSVCAVEPDWTGRKLLSCNEGAPSDEWLAVIERCNPRDIIWDPGLQQYTFIDGTSLAPRELQLRRHMWRIDSPGEYVRVFLQRVTPKHVDAILQYESRRGQAARPAQVRVMRVGEAGPVVAEWPYPSDRGGTGSMPTRIELAPGEALRVELVRDDVVVHVSPIYRP